MERVSRVPEVFQMAEELTSFLWEGTLMLACQGDSAGEQFLMVVLLCWGIRPFSASYLCGLGRLIAHRKSMTAALAAT